MIDTFSDIMERLSAKTRVTSLAWNHNASTEDTPFHDYCSEGPDSWCKWQCDQANSTNTKECGPCAVVQEILPKSFSPALGTFLKFTTGNDICPECLEVSFTSMDGYLR